MIATLVGLAGLVLGNTVSASAATPTTGADTSHTLPGELSLDEPTGPRLNDARTITLLTGQQVTVSSDSIGEVTVTPAGAVGVGATDQLPGDGPVRPVELQVTGVEARGKPTVLSAVPPAATALVDSGVIDRDLFDLNVLASRGLGVSSTPVTVYFDGVTTAAEAEQKADALPGSTYVSGTAGPGQATVSVPAASSATFWDAVTTARRFDPGSPEGQVWAHHPAGAPRDLADGLAGLSLDGAPLPAAPTSTTPNYQLTVRVHASKDPARWSWGEELGMEFTAASAPLIGVTGPTAGKLVNPSFSCEGTKPVCGTVVLTYTLPAGVYYLSAHFTDTRYTTSATTFFEEPEVAVFGNRTIDLSMDDGIWIAPRAPKRNELASYGISKRRELPDGQVVYNLAAGNGEAGVVGYYLVPTTAPTRTGAYNMHINDQWREPYITVTTDRGLDLRARYPYHEPAEPGEQGYRPELSLRDTRLRVVDAGVGDADDFARIDAKGKLVVLGPSPQQQVACGIERQVIERATTAGAVAVVFDPRTDRHPTGVCNVFHWVPILEGDVAVPAPNLPVLSIQPDEARQLRAQLTQQTVTVRVDSPGHTGTGYLYELSRDFSGGVPASIDQTVTADRLATRNTTLRGTSGIGPQLSTYSWYPGFNLLMNWSVGMFPTTTPGRSITEYLSVSRDVKWQRTWGAAGAEQATELVTRSDTREEVWFAQPQSVGPPAVPSETLDWDDWSFCSFCRNGDILTPFIYIGHPEPRHTSTTGWLPAMVMTDSRGQQVPVTKDPVGLRAFQMSPDEELYTFTSTMPTGDRFEWRFTSARVTGDRLPPGATCHNKYLYSGPCGAPQPLIFLRYLVPLDSGNSAPAASHHTVTITPYHQATDGPAIRQVATQVSLDGGTTWTPAKMKPLKNGSWTATFAVPSLVDTDGSVTLRTTATDDAGNTTDQLRVHAYGLR
ncbi:hypothetical protein ABZ793_31755 [Micromonospora sp. NPDC047465]|uniref:hypothetical protein n=1 Tax=Micromonospora sp. NPDC047465 TaxID=3154813 RepID=UPI0033F24C9B